MRVYDLYGVSARTLEAARLEVEAALSVVLQPHDSAYSGIYFRLESGREHLVLQRNGDPFEPKGEWMEPKHRDWPFLLYVNETERSDELAGLLTRSGNVQLIRHEVF